MFLLRSAIQTRQILTIYLCTTDFTKSLIKMLNSQPLIFSSRFRLDRNGEDVLSIFDINLYLDQTN